MKRISNHSIWFATALICLLLVTTIGAFQSGNAQQIIKVSTLPTACTPETSRLYFKTAATIGLYYCSATDTFSQVSAGTGTFAANNGSAGAPSISFANSATTGLYRSGADIIGFSAAGTGQWTLSATALAPVADNAETIGTTALAASNLFTRIATINGPNGGSNALKTATTTVNGSAAATISATDLIPAGSLVVGVSARITSTFSNTSLTAIDIGDGTTADLFANDIALASGTTTTYADHKSTFTPKIYVAATSVVMTGVGASFTTNGTIRLVVYYYSIVGPTS